MLLRSYSEKDLKEILALFYDAVHLVAAKDYSPAQLDAWAPRLPDEERWRNSLSAHYALVAEEGGKIVGFGDIDGISRSALRRCRFSAAGRGWRAGGRFGEIRF